MSTDRPTDAELDGCDIDLANLVQTPDDEVELLALFAEALDPKSSITVEQAEADWHALFKKKAS